MCACVPVCVPVYVPMCIHVPTPAHTCTGPSQARPVPNTEARGAAPSSCTVGGFMLMAAGTRFLAGRGLNGPLPALGPGSCVSALCSWGVTLPLHGCPGDGLVPSSETGAGPSVTGPVTERNSKELERLREGTRGP